MSSSTSRPPVSHHHAMTARLTSGLFLRFILGLFGFSFPTGAKEASAAAPAPLCDLAEGGCAYDLTLTNGPGASVHLVIDASGYLAVPEVAL